MLVAAGVGNPAKNACDAAGAGEPNENAAVGGGAAVTDGMRSGAAPLAAAAALIAGSGATGDGAGRDDACTSPSPLLHGSVSEMSVEKQERYNTNTRYQMSNGAFV